MDLNIKFSNAFSNEGKVNRVSFDNLNTQSLYRPQLEPLVYTCRTLGLLPWWRLFQVY